ncbi:MAG TPA: trehalose-phosphatase [Candidatus Dormibacteraeota bacterium]
MGPWFLTGCNALIPRKDPIDRLLQGGADRLLIATDFDGTLAAIVPEPADARPLPGAIEVLQELVPRVLRVAIVSGRSTADLQRLLPVEGLLLLGDYGQPDSRPSDLDALGRFNLAAAELVARFPGLQLEEKPASTSLHFRARPAPGPELLDQAQKLAEPLGLAVRRGRLVVEVLPGGWDKARALRHLLEELAPKAALYGGDDYGDRGCFEYLASLEMPHLAVGVSSPETPAEVFAACDLVVEGPERYLELFTRLAAATAALRP